MSNSQKKLERAFKFIKHDKIDKALEILRPIVEEEPDNVHAWWLFAYAATEPPEVREALVTVLRLDPNYANAPKAREMLTKLNQEYPPSTEEMMRFPELQDTFSDIFAEDDIFGESDYDFESAFGEAESAQPFSEDAFDDVFGGADFDEASFLTEDPFAELEQDPFAVEESESLPSVPVKVDDDVRLSARSLEAEELDDETVAAREEKAGRRRGRGRRLRFSLIFLVIIFGGIAAVLYFSSTSDDDGAEYVDPGELQEVVEVANLPDGSQVLQAKSDLGDTLYVRICGKPAASLPELIKIGMETAAEQVQQQGGDFDAVGVSIERCDGDYDTFYRAVVSVDDMQRYQRNEIDWASFQASWTKP